MKFLFIIFFFISSYVYAGDFKEYKNYTRNYGNFYKNEQHYKNYVPQPGDKIKKRGNKYQIYKGYVPQIGEYYKKGQKYKNFTPVPGSKIRRNYERN